MMGGGDDGGVGKAVDVRITGLVQGVSFRYYTRAEARGHGLTGWGGNQPDGEVAGQVGGPHPPRDALVAWCRGGPAYAEVDGVAVTAAEVTGATDFVVRTL